MTKFQGYAWKQLSNLPSRGSGQGASKEHWSWGGSKALRDPGNCLNLALYLSAFPLHLNIVYGENTNWLFLTIKDLGNQHGTGPILIKVTLTFIMLTASCLTRPSSFWRRRRSSSLALSTAFICSFISAFSFLCASSVFWAVLKAFSSSSKAITKRAENKYLKKYYHWAQVFHNQVTGSMSSCSSRTG